MTYEMQYSSHVSIPLITTTISNTITLQNYAIMGLKSIYKAGYQYKKAGVVLSEIGKASTYQADMFSCIVEKPELMKIMDVINARYGKGTHKLSQDGSRQCSRYAWKMLEESKSPEYTINWDELPVCG